MLLCLFSVLVLSPEASDIRQGYKRAGCSMKAQFSPKAPNASIHDAYLQESRVEVAFSQALGALFSQHELPDSPGLFLAGISLINQCEFRIIASIPVCS